MKRIFTMVEITLSLAVIGIGVAGIMALFPVGFNATRDAMGENYSADSSGYLLHYMQQEYKKDNTWPTSESLATAKSGCSESSTWTSLGAPFDALYTAGTSTFGIKQGSAAITDFSAYCKVWTSQPMLAGGGTPGNPPPAPVRLFAAGVNDNYEKAVRFNIEISWPMEKPYAARMKRFYCLEAFYNQ